VDTVFQRKKIDIKKGQIHLLRGVRRAGKTVYIQLLIKDLTEKIEGRKILYLPYDKHATKELKHIIKEFVQRFNGNFFI
jgi:predicted AAA+ superfamily ATPase